MQLAAILVGDDGWCAIPYNPGAYSIIPRPSNKCEVDVEARELTTSLHFFMKSKIIFWLIKVTRL